MVGLFFQIVIWESTDESKNPIYTTSQCSDLGIDTLLPGGFGSANFSLPESDQIKSRLINNFVGYHLVVFDFYGRRVYEGRILSVDIAAKNTNIIVEGYYAHASDLTHGVIYPTSTPKSISDVVKDTVALADYWSSDTTGIITTTTDITPQDFTGEKKLKDAIDEVLKYGSDDVSPVPLHFAIWENRKAYLFKQPVVDIDTAKWRVTRSNFVDVTGLSMSISRDSIYNKIQVLYDDPYIGQTFTDWFENTASQTKYGIREGTVNIGASTTTLATLVGELYIATYSEPSYSAKVGLQGLIRSLNGRDYPYMLRAGDLLSLDDYDYNIINPGVGSSTAFFGAAMISRTSYRASSNSVDIELSTNSAALDILLARLNIGSRSIG